MNSIDTLLSFALVITTIALAYLTWILSREAKKARKLQEEIYNPKLSVVIKPSKIWINFIFIHIENIGGSPLYDLKLDKVENDFDVNDKQQIKDLGYLKNIKYLKPKQKIEQFLLSAIERKDCLNTQFTLIFSYKNEKEHPFLNTFDFDLSCFKDMKQLGNEPLNEITKELKSIKKELAKIAKNS